MGPNENPLTSRIGGRMSFMEIIQIIMQIIAFISGLFGPKTGLRTVAYITEVDCYQAGWSVPAAVVGGEFTGTAEVRCRFDGKGGKGIKGLRSHLVSQLPHDGGALEAYVENYQGLPSLGFRTTLEMGASATAHGTTHIASNNATTLRNVFESHTIEATGVAEYLKSVYGEMEVTATEEDGVWELRASQAIRVQKPAGISNGFFKSRLKADSEGSLMDRAVSAAQEMASHL